METQEFNLHLATVAPRHVPLQLVILDAAANDREAANVWDELQAERLRGMAMFAKASQTKATSATGLMVGGSTIEFWQERQPAGVDGLYTEIESTNETRTRRVCRGAQPRLRELWAERVTHSVLGRWPRRPVADPGHQVTRRRAEPGQVRSVRQSKQRLVPAGSCRRRRCAPKRAGADRGRGVPARSG
jgi:hypothetical protein